MRKRNETLRTSVAVVIRAGQSRRGRRFVRSLGFSSIVSWTSSASFGWRGKQAVVALQDLTAQVRKLRVRIFIFGLGC